MPKENILKDWKHWLGWILSSLTLTGGIIGIFHLFGNHYIHTPLWNILLLFFIIFPIEVGVDWIKHMIKLQ